MLSISKDKKYWLFSFFLFTQVTFADSPIEGSSLHININPLELQFLSNAIAYTCTKGNCATGFFIGPGLVLTVAHIAKSKDLSSPVKVYTHYKTLDLKGTIEAIDRTHDLALISTQITDHSIFEIDYRKPQIGEEIYIIGYPDIPTLKSRLNKNPHLLTPMHLGAMYYFSKREHLFALTGKVTETLVHNPSKPPSMKYNATSPFTRGLSGAPVLSKDLKVIGINASISKTDVNKGYGTPHPYIQNFLNRYYKN